MEIRILRKTCHYEFESFPILKKDFPVILVVILISDFGGFAYT